MEGHSKKEALTKELKEWLEEESIKWPPTIPLPESRTTRWARMELPFGRHPEAKVFSDKGHTEGINQLEKLIAPTILDAESKKFVEESLNSQELIAYFTIPGYGTVMIKESYKNTFNVWLIRDGVVSDKCYLRFRNMDLHFRKDPTLLVKKDFTLVLISEIWSHEDQDIQDLNTNYPDLHLQYNEPEIKEELTKALTEWVGSITWPAEIPLPESFNSRQARLEVPFAKNPVATLHSTFSNFEKVDPLEGKKALKPGNDLHVYGDHAVSPRLIVDLKEKKVVARSWGGGKTALGFLKIPEFGTVFIKNGHSSDYTWPIRDYTCTLIRDGCYSQRVAFHIPESFNLQYRTNPELSFKGDFTIVIQTPVQTPEEYEADAKSEWESITR